MTLRRWQVSVSGDDMVGWSRRFWRRGSALAYRERMLTYDPDYVVVGP